MRRWLFLLLVLLLLLVPLWAQTPTPTRQTLQVVPLAYTPIPAAMAGFGGCIVGDTGCQTGLYICDDKEPDRCLFATAGVHTFTFSFASNGGAEAGQRIQVATSSINVIVQPQP